MKYLKDWRSANKYWSLETTSKRLSVLELDGKLSDIKISGWASIHHGDTFAIYRNESVINFYANGKNFKSGSPELAFTYFRIGGFEVFLVRSGIRILFKRFYNSWKQATDRINDPTSDGMDKDTEFFLQYCCNILGSQNRRDGLLNQWESWVVHIPEKIPR